MLCVTGLVTVNYRFLPYTRASYFSFNAPLVNANGVGLKKMKNVMISACLFICSLSNIFVSGQTKKNKEKLPVTFHQLHQVLFCMQCFIFVVQMFSIQSVKNEKNKERNWNRNVI